MIQTIRTETEALHALLHREGLAHHVSSTFWGTLHFVLGIGAAGLAGVAATSAGAHPLVTPATAAMLEGITAGAAGLMTMLKPSDMATRQKQYGAKYKALDGDVRHFATVTLLQANTFQEVDAPLREFEQRRGAMIEDGPGYSGLAYLVALALAKAFKERPFSPLPPDVREATLVVAASAPEPIAP